MIEEELYTTEVLLSESLGVPRDTLLKFRNDGALTEGLHWEKKRGWVVYNAEGEAAVRALLTLPPLEKKREAPAIWEATIEGHPSNPRVMLARITGFPATVRIRVPPLRRRQYAPGAVVQVRAVGDPGDGLFELLPFPRRQP
jgi:hypothetical protein